MEHLSKKPAYSLLLLGGVAALFLAAYSADTKVLAKTAEDIVRTCAESDFRPSCYDQEIPKLMDQGFSMEEAFAVTHLVQRLDTTFRYCHVLGHKLSAKETAKDPSRWKEVVARSPSGICSNGAIHGAFQERFRTESLPDVPLPELKKELEGICDARGTWQPTGLEQGSCIHALGHLTMYVTAADISKSLALCDEVGVTQRGYDMRQLCYDGAFMQIFQPLEPDDFALIEGKEQTKESAGTFCAGFSSPFLTSCVSESAALFRQEIRTDPDRIASHCSAVPDGSERERCKVSVVHYIIPQLDLDSGNTIAYCSELSGRDLDLCFSHAAARFMEIDWGNVDQALLLCEAAQTYGAGDACFAELAQMSVYNFRPDSKEARMLCAKLPEPWKNYCGDTRRP